MVSVWKKIKHQKSKVKLQPRVVSTKNYQTGKLPDLKADFQRKALPPGWRISKTGKKYYEGRRNRSDKLKSRL